MNYKIRAAQHGYVASPSPLGEGWGEAHSSIFSGNGNCVADSCSSILGGAGNTIPAGFPNSFIAGSGIVLNPGVTGNPNSLHVNGLWASALCGPGPAAYPPGTIYTRREYYLDLLRPVK